MNLLQNHEVEYLLDHNLACKEKVVGYGYVRSGLGIDRNAIGIQVPNESDDSYIIDPDKFGEGTPKWIVE